MKKIVLLVVKSYIGPLFLTFFIVVFLLLMQFLWKYIDDLVGKGLEISVITELLLYTSAGFVPLAFPLAILIASLMTFGNLGENNELLALKSAGISLQKIMSPLIYMTIVLSILAFFFANNVLPVINLHGQTLLIDIRHQRPELSIKAGVFYNGIEGYSIKIDNKDPVTNLLKGIKIYDHTDNKGNNKVTFADSGYMKMSDDETKLLLTMFNGRNYIEIDEKKRRNENKTYPHHKEYFKEENIIIQLEGFGLNRTDKTLFSNQYQMMTIKQLTHAQDSLNKELKAHYKSTCLALNSGIEKGVKYLKNIGSKPKLDTLNVNPYLIFNELNTDLKRKVYEKAISNARSLSHIVRANEMQILNSKVELRKHMIQWHKKITLAFACFIFFFIGAPLGAIIRKGGLGTPIVVSVIFFLVYYMITLTGEKLVREGLWNAFIGMWIASIILFFSGGFLTYKATTDSVILNTSTYIEAIKGIIKFKKRTKDENIADQQ